MDINCVYNCAHQCDGKCVFTELPDTFTSESRQPEKNADGVNNNGVGDVDCLYFEEKI